MVRLFLLSVAALMILGARNTKAENTTTTTTTTTTTAAPITTTLPPYRNHWKVHDGLNTCIMFDANVTVAVRYEIRDPVMNKTWRSDYINVVVPRDAAPSPDSSCEFIDVEYNVTAQLLRVLFVPAFSSGLQDEWTLSFFFTDDKKVNGGKAYGLYRIDLKVFYDNYTVFNNTERPTETFSSNKKTTFGGVIGANADRSAKCSTADLQITEFAKVHLDTFQVQAYGKNDTFLEAELCDHDVRTSDIVPIVVGACLAALVIIVLVAYLIGRARAKRQGYASV